MKLCCFLNYGPAYRESIFRQIDKTFDTHFYFGKEVVEDTISGIAKINYSIFKKTPIEFRNYRIFGKLLWRTKLVLLPFKGYDKFIITGDFSFSYIPFLLLCKLFNIEVIAWGHGAKSLDGKFAFFKRICYSLWSKYLTYSEGGKQRLIELGYPSNKIDVIYNSLCESVDPVLLSKFKSDILYERFKNNWPTIIFVGRLTKVKNLDWILKAQFEHAKRHLYYNVLIIGDGPMRSTLEEMASSYHTSNNVWFYGECYDEKQLNCLIYNSDLCVSPGNVGLTALHAMMYGTPVLTHDNFDMQMPEYETIVIGQTGSLYKYGSFEDFCIKIKDWLSENKDRNLIRRNCADMINSKWNSLYQISLLKTILQ